MIHTEAVGDIAIVAPKGHYAQAEFADAVERALAICPRGTARGLIMDFSDATGVGQHSVVRVRETTRHLAQHRDRYGCRAAVIAPSDDIVRVMDIGGVISHGQGITYRFCRDREEAARWLLEDPVHPPP